MSLDRSGAEQVLIVSEEQGVAFLTLNRPKQYNALSLEVLDQLHAALDVVANSPTARVAVIAANGRAFCAGHDLKALQAANDAVSVTTVFRRCADVMLKIAALPVPVIAEVQGMATAAGCQLVAQCDLAVATDDATFAVSGVNLGLFCSTPAVPLSRVLSRKRAAEMLLTALTLYAWGAAEHQYSLRTFLANLTMVPHLFHQPYLDEPYWTLQVEVRFYVLMFLLFIFPARVLGGWAYARGTSREEPRIWVSRWFGRLAVLPIVFAYVGVVFLSLHIGWKGVTGLYEQHAFLLPVPFVAWK